MAAACAPADALAPPSSGAEANAPASVLAQALRGTLEHHRAAAAADFDALHEGQKELAGRLRALLNALDRLLKLEPVRLEPPAVDAIRGAAAAARGLQARLRGVAARMERVETALAQLDAQRQA